MSLRESLRETVARCTPQGMQHATFEAASATARATTAQQGATLHRWKDATSDATTVQQGSCTPVATPARIRPRSCTRCRHLSRVKTCTKPVEAGLLPDFGIVWPEPAHGATCVAWSLNPAEAVVAVLTAAGRRGWTDEQMHQWLIDADAHPEVTLDALRLLNRGAL